MAKATVVPVEITRRDDGLVIDWDGQGHEAVYSARALRLSCPCAECVEEMSGRPLLDPGRIAADIRLAAIALVGTYGLRVTFSDGHAMGIFTFERLLQACPCARCGGGPGSSPDRVRQL